MSTFSDLKATVTNQLGANDASTSTAIRDNIINQSRKQFYSERRWSYLFKTATVTLTNQVGTLPTDYNKKFPPLDVYFYTGNVKFQLNRVNWGDVNLYDQSLYVYALDLDAGTIMINRTDIGSITFNYTYLPADTATDGSGDSTAEPAPDIMPIALLATARWWLASERATGKYQLFMDMYNQSLTQAMTIDSQNAGIIPIYPRSRRIRSGYWGRDY